MSDPVPLSWRRLPASLAADAVRQDQEERWARGQPLPIEVYLSSLPQVVASPDDAILIIYGEVLNRVARGETCDMAEYSRRFPQFAQRLADLFAVHGALSSLAPDPIDDATADPPQVPGFAELSLVARGGMGIVYRGVQSATGRVVALKFLADPLAIPEAHVRFLQEAEMLDRLRHPAIVEFLDTGVADGRLYLVTEWLAGGSLSARIQGQPQPAAWAVAMLGPIVEALTFAHQKGVIHRDIKPTNILLTEIGEPKLADFGVARWAAAGGTLSGTGQILGTASYMAPEQLHGQLTAIGPATDVYGLGAVLFECLSGRPPFDRKTALDPTTRSQVPDVRTSGIPIPDTLARIVARSLAPRPTDRYATAHELGLALRAWQG